MEPNEDVIWHENNEVEEDIVLDNRVDNNNQQLLDLPNQIVGELTGMKFTMRRENFARLGWGTFGTVFLGSCMSTNEAVALKRVDFSPPNDNEPHCDQGLPPSILREISLLKKLGEQHSNIVKLLDISYISASSITRSGVFLIFEYIDSDLNKLIFGDGANTYSVRRNGPTSDTVGARLLNRQEIRFIMTQLINAVSFLHCSSIMHRDLKPANVLVDPSTLRIKLADFGLARTITSNGCLLTDKVVTIWYRAPEVLLDCGYSFSIDIWSIGCIFYELMARKVLFPGQHGSQFDQLVTILECIGMPDESSWPTDCAVEWNSFPHLHNSPALLEEKISVFTEHEKDLLKQFTKFNPDQRINLRNVLHHPYFSCSSPSNSVCASHTRNSRNTPPPTLRSPINPNISPQADSGRSSAARSLRSLQSFNSSSSSEGAWLATDSTDFPTAITQPNNSNTQENSRIDLIRRIRLIRDGSLSQQGNQPR